MYYGQVAEQANARDCKSRGHWPTGVRIPPCPQDSCYEQVDNIAKIAQLAERIHGKDKAPGSNPGLGSGYNQ